LTVAENPGLARNFPKRGLFMHVYIQRRVMATIMNWTELKFASSVQINSVPLLRTRLKEVFKKQPKYRITMLSMLKILKYEVILAIGDHTLAVTGTSS